MASPHLDREASAAAAATFTAGLALGWLIHRHADDIKAAGTKVSDVSFLRGGAWGRGGGAPPLLSPACPHTPPALFLSHAACSLSVIISPPLSPSLPTHPQSISSAFGKLKSKLS